MTGKFDIKTYVGAGHLRFGMNQAKVEQLIGTAARQKKGFSGGATEYRRDNGLLTTYDSGTNELVEIGFSRNILELEYGDIKIFAEPPKEVFKNLANLDGNPYESVGFIVLLKLGITLTGFHDDDINQRAVTAFTRGRWDDLMQDLKPFNLTNFQIS